MLSAIAPGQSIRCGRLTCGMFSTRITTISATRPIGTFTRKIQRQPEIPAIESTPDSRPPMTGPITLDVPNTARK